MRYLSPSDIRQALSYEEMMARLQNIKTRGIALPSGATMADLYAERITN